MELCFTMFWRLSVTPLETKVGWQLLYAVGSQISDRLYGHVKVLLNDALFAVGTWQSLQMSAPVVSTTSLSPSSIEATASSFVLHK